ncbi:serine protease family S10 [Achlya hypogyna]|uniref:Carboxypeptidase n=1 Tax=Achlya hypogyna TaxID=1202772 RepID=A0A1V9Z5J7_ACHHY|nr:serine protease family S10 [Achlya hypogyna]
MPRLTALLGVAATCFATDLQTAHQITALPGYNDIQPLNFNQYAGHMPLPSNGQKMFYWHVESQDSPASDPLVLWLNGGPGCSSLGGFFTELGPFVVESDLSVKRNPYGWNRKTNMVFLESPSGVGFSQPFLNASQYNDEFTTARAREFLEQFLSAYPAYRNRDFYITGESYGGMYIPFLVDALLKAPIDGLHLKGFAIGNPYTDEAIDNQAYLDYYYTHGMISIEAYTDIQAKCNLDGLAKYAGVFSDHSSNNSCAQAVAEGVTESDSDRLNGYYIYGDVCLLENDQAKTLHYRDIRPMHRGPIAPCTDQFTQAYLRLPEVQSAIHVSGGHVDWKNCAGHQAIQYTRSKSSLPLYPTILAANLKALIYSGDADSVVNFIGTQRWITSSGLKLNVVDKWRAWFGPDKQLAGYTEGYAGLNFTTVKGAGHMVPAVRPLHALYMFECFVFGDAACSSFKYPKDNLEYLTGADVSVEEDEDAPVVASDASMNWTLFGVAAIVVGTIIAGAVFVMRRRAKKREYADLEEKTPLTASLDHGDGRHAHAIASLPGYNDDKPINFNQYAGHLVLPSTGQKMFYWFVESETNPELDPVVLWLNGGPGCSSLGGFFTELGPFVVESDLSVKRNPYAWNRKANMLFLESPAGVGFSKPLLNATDYNDVTTAARAHEFLKLFFDEYSEFKNRHVYITGESYAGQYIPNLVAKLLEDPLPGVNLVGMAIGNPVTDDTIDANAYMEYYYTHGMISLETFEDIKRVCKNDVGTYAGLYANTPCLSNHSLPCSNLCEGVVRDAIVSVDTDNLNPYYIYGDICLLQNNQIGALTYRPIRPMHRGPYAPCTDQFTQAYLRLPEVQAAIHIDSSSVVAWTDCNEKIAGMYNRSTSALPLYPRILATDLKTLIYSGDADSVVNFIGTERWISRQGLRLRVLEKWHSWFGPDKQLAGYTQKYDGLTFTTIKGAGHMVPATRPLHALYMFECFLYGSDLCKQFTYPKDNLEYLSGEDVSVDTSEASLMSTAVRRTVHAYVQEGSRFGGLVILGAVMLVVFAAIKHWRRDAKTRDYYAHLTSTTVPIAVMMTLLWSAVASLAAVAGASIKEQHVIPVMPGYNDLKPVAFKQYAGRLPLPSNGQEMFYWLVESQDSPASDPLVLWLNGGPGCSSLGGFFKELGPFVVASDLSIKNNKYAWNRKANMLFLESPAGVGFSQPVLNSTDYNDNFTADRAYEFLEQFFGAYPEFANREFYVTGESYAGRYVPFLLHKMVTSPIANVSLTGFALGNPSTDYHIDHNAYVDYYYSHGLISLENYEDVVANCGDSVGACVIAPENCSQPCASVLEEGIFSINESALNPYFIYGDVCLLENGQARALQYRKIQPMHRGPIGPCADEFTQSYLNRPDVQVALHLGGVATNWSDCNDAVSDVYHKSDSSLQFYPTLLSAGLKVLIYSGDADSVVNFMGTQRWIGSQGLKLHVLNKWRAWFGPDKQLAGYTEQYDGLNFTTVKGAGHMVPAVRPLHALYMFECFVFGDDACSTFEYPKDNLEYLTGADVSVEDFDDDRTSGASETTTSTTSSAKAIASTNWIVYSGFVLGIIAMVGLILYKQTATMAAVARGENYVANEFNPHKIPFLPNYNDPRPIDFDQYAGHLQLRSTKQKMFYWLVESERDPVLDPLVLWLNGGPGCSSLAGLFTELGPFVVEGDLSVRRNTYAWNRKVNMLFLESPAGVGFSQPLLSAAEYDDVITADRAYEFLVEFFTKYPAYYGRDFYIMGESYAGRYIPFLMHKLVTTPIPLVKLTGMAIGNPATDDKVDGNAYMDYYYTHAMISRENYLQMIEHCAGEELKKCMRSSVGCAPLCEAAIKVGILSASKQQLNPYNIYGDVCLLPNNQGDALHYRRIQQPRGDIGPCQDKFTQSYLQLHSVQEVLHVSGEHVAWADCNHNVTRLYSRSSSALPLYPRILAAGLKALIYSGDADSVVNFMGTERWIADMGLNLSVVKPWEAWIGPDKQLAGYTQEYQNLTFKTVKGAGHMVAAVRPLHALYLFECFVFGTDACAGFLYPTDGLEYLSGEHDGQPLIRLSRESPTLHAAATQTDAFGWRNVGAMACVGVVVVGALLRMYVLRHRRYRYQKL